MSLSVTRRRFFVAASLTILTSTGCLQQLAEQTKKDAKPLPESEFEGNDRHKDSAFSVYNNDNKEHIAKIQLVRSDVEEPPLLDDRYLIPKDTGQRVVSLVPTGKYLCDVSFNERSVKEEYEADSGKELALRFRDGKADLFTSYLE